MGYGYSTEFKEKVSTKKDYILGTGEQPYLSSLICPAESGDFKVLADTNINNPETEISNTTNSLRLEAVIFESEQPSELYPEFKDSVGWVYRIQDFSKTYQFRLETVGSAINTETMEEDELTLEQEFNITPLDKLE